MMIWSYDDLVQSVALVGQKGGSGKSTLACQLAVAAVIAGRRVALIDLDEQGSASDWGRARKAEAPTVIRAGWRDLSLALADFPDYDFVLVDTVGHASGVTASILRNVSLALCPLRPSALDVATAYQTAALVMAAGTNGIFVLNACKPRMREVAEARSALVTLLPVSDVEVGDRRPLARSIETGQGVLETDPESIGAQEITALWAAVEKALNVEHACI